MTTIALLDGDIFAFEVAAAAEVATDWGDGLWTLHAHEEPAKAVLADRVQSLVEAVGADELIIALSDKTNFRKTILPTYKANRNGIRRPMLLPVLRDYLRENYEVFEVPVWRVTMCWASCPHGINSREPRWSSPRTKTLTQFPVTCTTPTVLMMGSRV